MKVVITGATGFVGKVLTRKLQARGYDVAVLTRNPTAAVNTLPGIEAYAWDFSGTLPKADFLEGTDAIINLAGENIANRYWTSAQKARIRDSRVLGTKRLVELCAGLKQKPKVLVSASAIGFYGNRLDEELTEISSPSHDFLGNLGVAWEEEALNAKELGIRVSLIRTGIVLGKDGGAMAKMLPPFKFGLGGPLGDGLQWMSWIHVDDLAELYIHAMEEESAPEVLNGTAPEPVRNETFTKTLADALGRPAFFRVPAFFLRLVFGEMSGILLGSQRVLPQQTLQSGFEFLYPVLSDALRDIAEG